MGAAAWLVVSSGGVPSDCDRVGVTAVQIVWSSRRGSRSIEHIGSVHDDAEMEALKAAAGSRATGARSRAGWR
jgi:hypothetical protein